MKFVITGALGHIGSRVIRDLPNVFPGSEVVMIDNMLTQRYCSLFNLPNEGNYRFIEADILEADLEAIFSGADVVVQLAAITDAANSFKNKDAIENNNFHATERIAKACCSVGCPMIHMSSTSVYGTQKEKVDENCPEEDLQPQSPYAETKLKEERLLELIGRESGLRFITLRCGTICGVSPGMRFHTAVNKFCWQAVLGQPLTVWSTALHQKRPYLSLDDTINAYIHIIKNNLFDNRIYNVLTANLTVDDIIGYIKQYVTEIDIQYVDTEIMDQLSYDVSNGRFKKKDFVFVGDIKKVISETIAVLKKAGGLS